MTPQPTAIQQLLDSLPLRFRNAMLNECAEEIRQAKARFREQILQAYCDGSPQFRDCSEDYYGENFLP